MGERFNLDLWAYLVITIFLIFNIRFFTYYHYIGALLILVGYFIWVLALVALGDSFQCRAEAKKLVSSGVYLKMRHPIYYSGFLSEFGWVVYTFRTTYFWFFLLFWFLEIFLQVSRIKKEERVLSKKFGENYIKYKKKTWF